MKYKEILVDFSKFYPIRGKKVEEFTKYILEKYLNNINYYLSEFINRSPIGKSELYADGKLIESLPSSFVSGKIDEKNIISNVFVKSDYNEPNISFNPYSDEISLVTFYYESPSITISRKNVSDVLNAEEIEGYVHINEERHKAYNILVGNINNPKNIIITHYDTVLNGASDNSSGTSILLKVIKEHKELLSENLFVLSGAEELSYDFPIYWGYGYRVFEYEYKELLRNSKRIIVVDTLGFDFPILIKNNFDIIIEAFPIKNLGEFIGKTYLLTSIDLENKKKRKMFYSFYHSNLDTVNIIDERYMIEAEKILIDLIK